MNHTAITSLDATAARQVIPALAEVLIDCVEGGASISFMLPLTREKAERFWSNVAESVARDERVLLVARDGGRIVGTVQLVFAPENQPHRADIAKMLVIREARRKGLGEALMRAVEDEARDRAITLLTLDTTTGQPAERLYSRLGWTCFGEIKAHALMPDGTMSDTRFFYKTL